MTDARLPSVEITTGAVPRASIVWLHGLGADGHDFESVVPQLGLAPDFPVRFIFPHAPPRPVTINGGQVMRAWYDIASPDFKQRQDTAGIHASARLITALLDHEQQRGIPSQRIVLAGFSQGGAIALHTGLRYAHPLAGILALSTYLPLADTLTAEAHAANRTTPIFMAHGHDDNVIPQRLAEASRELLTRAGYELAWHTYAMAHGVCWEEIRKIGAWLNNLLHVATED